MRKAIINWIFLVIIFSLVISCHKKHNINNSSKISKGDNVKLATFAAGCFWGIEAEFRKINGVVETRVGYTGGHKHNPTYEQVCRGNTGHAEAVEVIYNPSKITYEELLEVFWKIHDPTQHNRQGPDVGEQYRSAIFYHSEKQKKLSELSKRRMNETKYNGRIATQILESSEFWQAEEYHQRYYEKKGIASCPK